MFKWIEKKDLVYWLIILITVWLLNSNYHTTLSQWAFAGTIISIILAVLAIIYSFDQSSTTLYSTRKLEETTEEIRAITEVLKETSINDFFINLEQKIESLDKNIDNNLKNSLHEHSSKMEFLILNKGYAKNIESDLEIFSDEEEWKKYIRLCLSVRSIPGAILYYIYLIKSNEMEVDIYSLALHLSIKTNKEESEGNVLYYILRSAFDVFISFNILRLANGSKNESIEYISPSFKNAIESVLKEFDDNLLLKDVAAAVETQKHH